MKIKLPWKKEETNAPSGFVGPVGQPSQLGLADMVLNTIEEGVLITDENGVIQMINPAAVTMIGCGGPEAAVGVNFVSTVHLENGEGLPIDENSNTLMLAIRNGNELNTREFVLVSLQGQRWPVAFSVKPVNGQRVITFRDISKELEEEGAQMEFISTASHEMRTPVASIEGYLGLALNPQTATIDERARKYLDEAHTASQHLGKLFRDLLDVTKLEDRRVQVKMVPVELTTLVHDIVDGQVPAIQTKGIQYTFGATDGPVQPEHRMEQLVYASVDVDFLREILNNLVDNAIKYTPEGGAIWVNVRGDGDRVLINVTDTGMGISPEDLKHIFQKFYRADNSQTRTIGGTGLGLYLVQQRVEAMGGKVWAESSFGEGSTFYVSLPRLTAIEFERRKQILQNQEAMRSTAGQV